MEEIWKKLVRTFLNNQYITADISLALNARSTELHVQNNVSKRIDNRSSKNIYTCLL